ncbi:MCE family protein [Thiotrichales bacterium 19S3-7]|nr:MCE family protein [Thiotrichales bacterium 19S3-7]MCF6802015.1 MCE family protein [Thiotrichales bacterium 19S3-11]
MRNRKQFITLGIFVILSTAAMIIIALWLTVGISKNTYYNYVSVFHEPVDGLSANSNVLYNGVNVGKVQSIELDHTNPGNIYVTLAIVAGTPITKHTYATIQPQGITGLSYISLQTPKNELDSEIELLAPKSKPPYPIIKSKLSFFSSLTDKFQQLSDNLNGIFNKVNNILNEQNTQHIGNILENVDALSNNLKQTSEETTKLIKSANNITSSFEKNNQKIDSIIDNVNESTKHLDLVSNQILSLTTTVEQQTLPNINNVLIPQLSNTLNGFNQLSTNINQLVDKLDQNPSMLIKGQVPLQPGPGE